ncbi:MAG: hypothetical protein DHS20C14_20810 [Phycisphaeraceae bacterium]|nr:MAG: hypothetical protein DHS20C14_20810 [Phycisphaeraceae bacterium]
MTVRDCDLNTSLSTIETVYVVVSSTTDPVGVVLTLTETDPDTAEFVGTLTYDTAGADLAVNNGDDITATYSDADTGAGGPAVPAVATALADCLPTLFSTPTVTGIWYNAGTVMVHTNEFAKVRLEYGPSMSELTELDLNHPMGTTHRLPIAGLSPETVYYYALHATDNAGNESISDKNGLGHTFRTSRAPEPVHEFPVDDTDPGWSTTGLWEFGQPTGNSSDPGSAFSGLNMYGYNLDGKYESNMPEEFLTSGLIDLTGVVEVRVDFERWLSVEPDVFIAAEFQVRSGGGVWERVWHHTGGRRQPEDWDHVSYLVAEIADNQPDFQLRWTMGPGNHVSTEGGWNIDDIVLTGVVLEGLCPADLDGNGLLNMDDIDFFVAAFVAGDLAADLDGNGSLNVDDIDTFVGLFTGGCPDPQGG